MASLLVRLQAERRKRLTGLSLRLTSKASLFGNRSFANYTIIGFLRFILLAEDDGVKGAAGAGFYHSVPFDQSALVGRTA